jgi:hypothetical protein
MYNILYVTKVNEKPYPRILISSTCAQSVDKIIAWLNENPGHHFSGSVDKDANTYVRCITLHGASPDTGQSDSFLHEIELFEQKRKDDVERQRLLDQAKGKNKLVEGATIIFENGDILKMEVNAVFFGHTESGRPTTENKISISYGEKIKKSDTEFYYAAVGMQYFELSEKEKAYDIFLTRSLSPTPTKPIKKI